MPEASVNEYGQLVHLKNEVWFSEHGQIAPPARDVVATEQFCQRQFRVLVPASSNPRHHLRSLGFGEDVGHATISCFRRSTGKVE